jgi:hypothetical protein
MRPQVLLKRQDCPAPARQKKILTSTLQPTGPKSLSWRTSSIHTYRDSLRATQSCAEPVMVEHPYRVGGSIVALGQSPKTEYMWFETALNEPEGKRVAEMRMLLRFMKASSPKYKDATAN